MCKINIGMPQNVLNSFLTGHMRAESPHVPDVELVSKIGCAVIWVYFGETHVTNTDIIQLTLNDVDNFQREHN